MDLPSNSDGNVKSADFVIVGRLSGDDDDDKQQEIEWDALNGSQGKENHFKSEWIWSTRFISK